MREHGGALKTSEVAALLSLMIARVEAEDNQVWGSHVFRVLPFPGYLDLADATSLLAQMEKPLICIPVRATAPALAVWQTRFVSADYTNGDLDVLDEYLSERSSELESAEKSILVIGRDECVRASLRDLNYWRQNFRVQYRGVALYEPGAAQTALGIAQVVKFFTDSEDRTAAIRLA